MKAILTFLALVLFIPLSVLAQIPDSTRFTPGAAFIIAEPKEDFRENVGNGYGGVGNLLYRLDGAGWFSLAVDGFWLRYGHEKKRVPISRSIGARILVDVNTTNAIGGIGVGPEFAVPFGRIRPYLNGAFSGLAFRTTSSVEGLGTTDEPFAHTTNSSDWTRAWVVGTGVRIPLPSEHSNFSVDVGLRYYRGGEALYLREGSIRDHPDGSISINPLFSETPFLVYSIGVRYRIPWNSSSDCPRWLC